MNKRYFEAAVYILCVISFFVSCSSSTNKGVIYNDNSAIIQELSEISDDFGISLEEDDHHVLPASNPLVNITARSGKIELLKYLVEKGNDVNAKDGYGNSPLHYAVLNANSEMVDYLIKKGADVNSKNALNVTPFHIAVLISPFLSTRREFPSLIPLNGVLTSYFGIRKHPFSGKFQLHQGIDIAASLGSPIKASADGRVLKTGWFKEFGNVVIIQHADGMKTIYGHCSEVKVSKYASVKRGDVIALVGSTGVSTGPHCHFEIRWNGLSVNPQCFLYGKPGESDTVSSRIISTLISHGAQIEVADASGRTPVFYSINKKTEMMQKIITLGGNVNVYDRSGLTPLLVAIISGNYDSVVFLLKNGAYVNAKTRGKVTLGAGKYILAGETPLSVAMKQENLPIAKIIAKYGGKL